MCVCVCVCVCIEREREREREREERERKTRFFENFIKFLIHIKFLKSFKNLSQKRYSF